MSESNAAPPPNALPTPPRKPEPYECCGTGCIPCVMDIYEEELWEYERALKRAGDPPPPKESPT